MSRPDRVPAGLWVKCEDCKAILYHKEVSQNFQVCARCGYYHGRQVREVEEV